MTPVMRVMKIELATQRSKATFKNKLYILKMAQKSSFLRRVLRRVRRATRRGWVTQPLQPNTAPPRPS